MSDPIQELWSPALEAFDHNDVTVAQALAHLSPELPALRLLELRRAPSREHVAEARALLGGAAHPLLVEGFVAGPLEVMGDAEAALRERLAALPRVARWESLTAAYVLRRIGRAALALGRAELATDAARRSLSFVPLDPMALALLSDALAADGRAGEAASIRASLWDAGYGSDVLPGAPSAADRAAIPAAPSVLELAPMSAEDRARFAVGSLWDPSLLETVTSVVRHASVLLRCGHVAQAWVTLEALRAWEANGSSHLRWLGIDEGDDDRRLPHASVLRAAVEATPAGIAAVAAAKKKAPNVAAKLYPARLSGVAEVAERDAEPALLDVSVGVRQAARLRLASHPLVLRAQAIEGDTPGVGRFYAGEALELHGESSSMAGVWPPRLPPEHPAAGLEKAVRAPHPADRESPPGEPWIEPASAPKPACKGCKAPFDAGEPQLRVREPWEPRSKAAPFHLRCATKGKAKAALAFAGPRYRRADLGGKA